jgi:polyhydroxybutyrate depolymerase
VKPALAALLLVACARPDPLRERPYELHLPNNVEPARPAPLVLLLHCFGCDVATIRRILPLDALADREGFIVATPRGFVDSNGRPYWNATDACCDPEQRPDDVAYLMRVLDDVEAKHRVDEKRVFAVGFSNGGFMAHRLACDRAARFAGVVSAGGASWKDAARCAPSEPVAVLEIHGDADPIIAYGGGTFSPGGRALTPFPSARETIAGWARRDGCAAEPVPAPPMDVDPALPGAETEVTRFGGCRGGAAELWTLRGGGHSLDARFVEPLWRFLASHPKP